MSRVNDALSSLRVAKVLAAGFPGLNHGASCAVIMTQAYAACSAARTVPKCLCLNPQLERARRRVMRVIMAQ